MSTIEELLATPQVEEVWEVDNRYVINSSYSDDQGPIEIVGKDIGDMSSQISIQGESISQYVEFIMPRYYDNIDLSEKNIVIHYTAGDRGGENAPINVYKSQERIKFGWAIPASATANEGTLSIGVWARGYVGTEEYMWKSRIAYYKVERGPVLGEGLSEPDVQWYLDFVREMDAKVTEASLYSTRAKQSENVAVESKESAIVSSQTASDSANTAVQKAAEASNSASVASAHSAAAKVSADNAKESETKAQGYAEEARNNAEGFEPISDMMTGKNPTSQNSTNAPFIYGKFKGYIEQQTYSGKNKSSAGNLTGTLDTVIPINHLVDGTTYTLSCVLSSTDTDSSSCMIYKRGSSGEKRLTNGIRNTRMSLNFTKESGDTDIRIFAGASYDFSIGDTITTNDIQIEEGTTATPYEPYVGGIASPNPDYPQEINGLAKDGAIEVKSTGKNLLQITADTRTIAGVTFTIDKINGTVNCDGTASIAETEIARIEVARIDCKKYYGKKINLSGCPSGGGLTSYRCTYVIVYNDGTANDWSRGDFGSSCTIDVEENMVEIVYLITITKGYTVNNLIYKPQLEIGDTFTGFEPYTEITAAITTGAPLYEGDYIEIYADGSGKLVRAMAEVVFDGSRDWTYWTNNSTANYFYATLASLGCMDAATDNSRACAYSSHFKGVERNNLPSSFEQIATELGDKQKSYLYFNTQVATSAAEWKTWLQSNPVTVVYELAEPTETLLTAEQVAQFKKLYTFEPVTNVLCDGEVEMIYFRNNPNGRVAGMLQRQIDSITSALSAEAEEV